MITLFSRIGVVETKFELDRRYEDDRNTRTRVRFMLFLHEGLCEWITWFAVFLR